MKHRNNVLLLDDGFTKCKFLTCNIILFYFLRYKEEKKKYKKKRLSSPSYMQQPSGTQNISDAKKGTILQALNERIFSTVSRCLNGLSTS